MFTKKMVATLTCTVINPVNGVSETDQMPKMALMRRLLVDRPVTAELKFPQKTGETRPTEVNDETFVMEHDTPGALSALPGTTSNAYEEFAAGSPNYFQDKELSEELVNHQWYDAFEYEGETITFPDRFINHIGNPDDAPQFFHDYVGSDAAGADLWSTLDLSAAPDSESIGALKNFFDGWNDFLIKETFDTVVMSEGTVSAKWGFETLLKEGLVHEESGRHIFMLPLVLAAACFAWWLGFAVCQGKKLTTPMHILGGFVGAASVATTVASVMLMHPTESCADVLHSLTGTTNIIPETEIVFEQFPLECTAIIGGSLLFVLFTTFVILQILGKGRHDGKNLKDVFSNYCTSYKR